MLNFSPIISADKIGRVIYKNWPIFCRPTKSANFIVRLSLALECDILLISSEPQLAYSWQRMGEQQSRSE